MIFLLTARTIFAFSFFVGFSFLFFQNVSGQTASVDTTFNGTGRQFTDFGAASQDVAYDLLIQNDGKIIAVGGANAQGGLARYNTDGSADTTFGTNGSVAYGSTLFFNTGALQTGGKILTSDYTNLGFNQPYNAVSRFNADGSADLTFGVGGTVVLTAIPGSINQSYNRIFVQTDGKILLVGQGVIGGIIKVVLFRLNADGTPDTTFDGDGADSVMITAGSQELLGNARLQPDGKILISGGTNAFGVFNDTFFARVNADGSLDSTFGASGIAHFDFYPNNNDSGGVFALLPNSQFVAPVSARNAGNTEVLATARFNADGSLDTSYGTAGIFKTTRTGITINDFIRQPDGKFIFTGAGSASGYALGRYNADGSLDTTFAASGIFSSIRYGTSTAAYAVKIQPDFKILVAGSDSSPGTNQNFFVARFNNTTVTAASASISGRVTGGKGLANARIQLTGTGGVTRTVLTNSFGNFTFSDVESGATYIVNVSAKRYTFAPQVVSVTGNISGLTFTAQ